MQAAEEGTAATAALQQLFAAQQHLPGAGSTCALSSVEAQPGGPLQGWIPPRTAFPGSHLQLSMPKVTLW